MDHIRNFSIIAHIDHGKSTLADRIIERTGGLSAREMSSQVLDSMELERERGITIKAQTAALRYTARNGREYELNLIDTPGHVDFSYEVSRSLSACEGALLVVDASQGVEAQTVANCYTATELGVEVVPVLNKIDLPSAQPERAIQEIEDVIGIDATDGVLRPKDRIKLMATGALHLVEQVGVFTPKSVARDELSAGGVGFMIAGIKEPKDAKVGDTVTLAENPAAEPLPGFKEIQPQVFAGLYPVESNQYEALRDALAKLQLNDSSLRYEPETSQALGFGFRCGFLGLLHMDIVQERLEREYDMELITTAPTVVYQVLTRDGTVTEIDNPSKLPDPSRIEEIREPIIRATIIMPQEYVGPVITLCEQKRGSQVNMQYVGRQVILTYDMPLNEIVMDFFDKLKSTSRGYASLDYEFREFRGGDLVRLDILINGDRVDALSIIVHRETARFRGRDLATRMRQLIPRQMFDVAVQAAIGADIIARENIKALRKNVLAKCYGGDITRKRKLLEKQKAGKKRMKQVGSVEIPQEAFLAILQVDSK